MAPAPPDQGPSRRAIAVRVALLAVVVGALVALSVTGSLPSPGDIRDLGDSLGGAAPFVWPPLFAALNMVVPWPVLAGASGLLFGTAPGTALALAGVLTAASLQFAIARKLAGEDLRRRVLRRVARIDALLERNGFLAAFYSRLVPGISWGLVNYAAGLSRLRLRFLLLATATAGLPKIFAYTALGGSFNDLSSTEARVAIGLLVALAVLGLLLVRRGFAAQPPPPAS